MLGCWETRRIQRQQSTRYARPMWPLWLGGPPAGLGCVWGLPLAVCPRWPGFLASGLSVQKAGWSQASRDELVAIVISGPARGISKHLPAPTTVHSQRRGNRSPPSRNPQGSEQTWKERLLAGFPGSRRARHSLSQWSVSTATRKAHS